MAAKKSADVKPANAAKTAAKTASKSAAKTAASDLKAQFEAAAQRAQALKQRPDDQTLLKLYALYKQSTEGDVRGTKPGFFDFVASAKYEAWAQLKGTSAETAMREYIALVDRLSR